MKQIIQTDAAPKAIGTYSQAVKIGNTVYLSGQIPLDPVAQKLIIGDIRSQIVQVFKNLSAVCQAAGGDLKDIAMLNVFLTDLNHFALINEVMADFFVAPYPARAAMQVSKLPLNAAVEITAIMQLDD